MSINGGQDGPELVPYELECAAIASVMRNNGLFDVMAQTIGAEHFGMPPLAGAWKAAEKLLRFNINVDPLSLAGALEVDPFYRDQVEDWGQYFKRMMVEAISAPSPQVAEHHAGLILRAYQIRALYYLAEDTLSQVQKRESEEQILEMVTTEVARIADAQKTTSTVKPIQDYLADNVDSLIDRARAGGGLSGYSYGYTELDNMTAGIQAPDLILIGGRPSMGKTSLAMSIASNLADAGEPVLFFSLESSGRSLGMRRLARETGISPHDMARGTWDMFQEPELRTAFERMKHQTNFWVDDSAGLTVDQMYSRARRLKRTHGLSCVVADHLGFVKPSRKISNRTHELEEICHGFRDMAKGLDMPVILLSQLSRDLERRDDKRPVLSDLRDSGAIEQDADVVMFVYRHEYYLKRQRKEVKDAAKMADQQAEIDEYKGKAEVILAKQREGPVGTVNLLFDERTQVFDNP